MNGRRLLLILSALVVILILVAPALGSEEQDWFVIDNADAVATRAALEAFTSPVPLDPRFILQDPKTTGVRQVATVPPEMPRALGPRFILQDPKTLGVRDVVTVPPEMPRDLDPRFILQDPKTMGVREMMEVPAEMSLGLDPRFILQDPKTIRFISMAYPCELVGEPDDPVISELQVTDIQTDRATVSWMTDEYTDGLLEYGLASGSYSWTAYEEEYGGSHSFLLTGLSECTRYYYRVSSTDRCGNTATSIEDSFVTAGCAPLVIDYVQATDITEETATIRWTTSAQADSLVEYGVFSGVYPLSVSSPDYVTEHALDLTGLLSATTYYYQVTSAEAGGNNATSTEYSFRTRGVRVYLPLILREY